MDEYHGGDESPVMSHDKRIDLNEPIIWEGETPYEGKGKGRSEGFSDLPIPGDSAPSTAPSTRPVSQSEGDSAPSTAPSTRPVSQNSSGLPINNRRDTHECGCTDIYDDYGRKRQQACDLHKTNPMRSMLPLPPKRPLSEVTNLDGGTQRMSMYMPQAERNEDSPNPGPPVMTPINSERAIEPTGPPDTLTITPTQEATHNTKRRGQRRARGPKASDSKATDPNAVLPATTPQIAQEAGTEPSQIESSEDNEDGGVRLYDEHPGQSPVNEGGKSVGGASDPAFRKEHGPLKSILKTTGGTTAEARPKKTARVIPEPVNDDGEKPKDNSEGARLFHASAGMLRDPSGPVHQAQGGAPVPSLLLHTEEGSIEEPVIDSGPSAPGGVDPGNNAGIMPPGDHDDNDSSEGGMTCPSCVLT